MSTSLEKAQNTSLEVQTEQPRLISTFGEKANNIIHCVEIENPGASLVLTSHYATINFKSKPLEYWNAKFKTDFMEWAVKLGITADISDHVNLLDVQDALINYLGIHNEESVLTAIRLNQMRELGERVVSYQKLNGKFLIELMVAYEAKLKVDNKRALEIRDKLKAPIEQELSESQKDELMKVEIQKIYHQYVIELRNDIELISYSIYDFLDRKNMVNLDKQQKLELMKEAEATIKAIGRENRRDIRDGEVLPLPKEISPLESAVMAKRLAVRNYFNDRILNRVENLF